MRLSSLVMALVGLGGLALVGCATSNSTNYGDKVVVVGAPGQQHTPRRAPAPQPARVGQDSRVVDLGSTPEGQVTASSAATAPRAAAPSGTYRVVKGDTLFSIAFRYGLNYKTLANLNGIEEPYAINEGQLLRLSDAPVGDGKAHFYTVKPGDTLYSIAAAQGVTATYLARLNDLEQPYTVRLGQRLKVQEGKEESGRSAATPPAARQAPAQKPTASAP
ncbi:MAG: LysM peptidoglycan-binding domain-containing protein, partial [Succinivibrionaceae bacterium]|nr:LysM peptidoglycan-binding domain-containing protein [Succinivibrionaceae bacterium]